MKTEKLSQYIAGFIGVFVLAVISYIFANQVAIKQYGLGYALWALLLGLIIANTAGTPQWLKAGAKSELYIKTGLVLLGAEILFNNILRLGAPGIMNVLIGIIAFFIALYWVSSVESRNKNHKPNIMEIWNRFPKFILGFILASITFSFLLIPMLGEDSVNSILKQTKTFRGWFFCLAFVSIGLESNFKELADQLSGGKPIILYVIGQSFNIVLTFIIAWIAFGIIWN